MARPPPDLKIPPSNTSVRVQIIDTTSKIDAIPTAGFVSPEIKGFTALSCPAFSFLIEHPVKHPFLFPHRYKLQFLLFLFDLGIRKDLENFAPMIKNRIKTGGWNVTVQQGVAEQLSVNNHYDHTGDPSTSTTTLVVGPGFKSNFTPGYPANQDRPIRESDYEGRELREISFEEKELKIGNFKAFDSFGDGSFYLLDSPGHAIGHMCGLARVTTNPDTFIFMGGDACHHGGEFRPSPYLPLPTHISPNPLHPSNPTPYPGSLFHPLLRDGDDTRPFYEIARLPDRKLVAHDADEAERTIGKVIEADARDDVLVVMAHDESLVGVVEFFPQYADDFQKKGWVEKSRWLFLRDFRGAVDERGT
ncbi:hypothetical protein B0J14DRAFT_625064 [Halenospora varia]|nr:hypothetical protein B0J14DRAFT_625064 [Halenospora varia]